ncbi:MAG: sigma 54-interacting transcriptional regulator, partial [Candidatus Entotheonellia bacterium]
MAETGKNGIQEPRHTHPGGTADQTRLTDMLRKFDPTGLAFRAYDVLEEGILLVSPQGYICYYNQAYAHQRRIPPHVLIGHSVEHVERRQRLQLLLRTGAVPPELEVVHERRRTRETLVPIREGEQLLGVMVIVTPVRYQVEPTLLPTFKRASSQRGREPAWPARYTFADIIGQSPALVHACELARQAAQGGSSVLLVGESGTGKELFAHAIHAASPRQRAPFVPVDCSAIPRELLEAELFGYAPGAFTGAAKEGKVGKFELAQGG